jgi:UDPglucose 6-dehydrogenase
MKLGVIGVGVVGSAISYGFSKLGHEVFKHDIKFDTNISDVLDTDIVFICLPTPSNENGECDTSIVEGAVRSLCELDYSGYICIKSTVIPGTTKRLIEELGNPKIKFIPEFLRERCASTDFTENHQLLIIGTENQDYEPVVKAHGHYPQAIEVMSTTEAECCKYFLNCYNATLVTFANSMCSFVEAKGGNYQTVSGAMRNIEHVSKYYLDSNNNFKRFGGACLPKDLRAVVNEIKNMNRDDIAFFENILTENEKY